jgi:uncharacterized protein (DUF1499 family)
MLDFATLRRPWKPNNYLLAPGNLTPARTDGPAPEFAVPADRLIDAFRKVALSQPRTVETGFDRQLNQAEFVQRSRIFRFPDTLTARAVPLAPDRAALALYSRARYGIRDFGVNRVRVHYWLELLGAALGKPG